MDNLNQEEPEVRRRLADMTRKITVLRVNEKALVRRYNAMQDIEGGLRKVTYNCSHLLYERSGWPRALAVVEPCVTFDIINFLLVYMEILQSIYI